MLSLFGTKRHDDPIRDSPELARKPLPVILALSASIAGRSIWLIYFKGRVAGPDLDLRVCRPPTLVFNSLSATLPGFGVP